MTLDSDMQFFALLARQSSFSGAALELGISPSAVSRRLARIEDRLGTRLMNRTTRRTSLTSEGEAYLEAALAIASQIEMIEQSLARSRERPRGLLKVNATFQFGREHIAPAIGDFIGQHPEVEAQLVLSDAPHNLVEEGFDLGIRFGLPPSSRLISRLLMRNRRLLVAAPSYLARHGTPRRLADLAAHNCIVLRQEHDAYDVWRFEGGDSVKVSGTLSTNDGEIAVNWAIQGLGIMMRSEWDVNRHIAAGRLRVVLPRHHSVAHIYAVYPERLNLSAKVRHFIDFLRHRLEKIRPPVE
ncbi:MAG TPA: LysR family transcriptional regulator [Geminicoccus sp.]|jgi:DNA-binding transcriptional LysR family regulator|uniref:LysR family transcriptional regulator n=1 Tax=Geminicoccus sp. TaxID=2024832 RepID=UPI002E381B31|nr:LysR family transcriptional regulator [Geminicoccus sp.]HEX2527612.1 LysR family transcriptional regulator [Geminicoccus sp.]